MTGVNYSFGKYCVHTLDSRYTIDPLAEISLFPEEKKILEKYIPKGPHISLFKWLTEESKATFDKENKENQENANYILTDTKKIGSDWKKIKEDSVKEVVALSLRQENKQTQKALEKKINTFLTVAADSFL